MNKSSKYEIKIVESILINKLGPNLNDRGSSFPLSILQWTNLKEFNFTFYLIINLIFVTIIILKMLYHFILSDICFFNLNVLTIENNFKLKIECFCEIKNII